MQVDVILPNAIFYWETNFGVTSPLWDELLGTRYSTPDLRSGKRE